ncbi:hypothetical protein EJ08DRAFT_697810 [Tothia fuscella]|uniref:Uncharacterized protein n=1 Tax=Tothia fuscella TaxID=1048955 RepID=A0A9P4NRM4_9PEZI|nr:hypothetical protein EJ08DRAFT_697810 [Tothia fuscella]
MTNHHFPNSTFTGPHGFPSTKAHGHLAPDEQRYDEGTRHVGRFRAINSNPVEYVDVAGLIGPDGSYWSMNQVTLPKNVGASGLEKRSQIADAREGPGARPFTTQSSVLRRGYQASIEGSWTATRAGGYAHSSSETTTITSPLFLATSLNAGTKSRPNLMNPAQLLSPHLPALSTDPLSPVSTLQVPSTSLALPVPTTPQSDPIIHALA